MARKHEAVEWLKKGYSPSKIAEQMGVTVSTVMGYLYNEVGEGKIRRSDILFSIDENIRDTIEHLISETGTTYWGDIYRAINRSDKQIDQDDSRIYLTLRDARLVFGDMYEIIRDIEISLYNAIKDILLLEYGPNDWWRKGIPENIRAECAAFRERDLEPANEPYCYANFIHLKEILDKQWKVFTKTLPKKLLSEKKKLLSGLTKLNQIRNSVMHPVRGTVLTNKDFAFVRKFRDYLELEQWKNNLNNEE